MHKQLQDFYSFIYNLSSMHRYLLSNVSLLLLIIAWYFLCFTPLSHRLDAYQSDSAVLEIKKKLLEKQVNQQQKLADELELLKNIMKERSLRFIATERTFQKKIAALCKKYKISSHEYSNITSLKELTVCSCTIPFEGAFEVLMQLCNELVRYNIYCSSITIDKVGRHIKAALTLIGVIGKKRDKKNVVQNNSNGQSDQHVKSISIPSPFNPADSRYRYAYIAHCIVHNSFQHFGVVLIDGNTYMVKQGGTYAQHFIQSISNEGIAVKDEHNKVWCIPLKKIPSTCIS